MRSIGVLMLVASGILALTGCANQEGQGQAATGNVIPGVTAGSVPPTREGPAATTAVQSTDQGSGPTSQTPTPDAPGAAFVGGDDPIPENWPAGFSFPADMHYVSATSAVDNMNVTFNSAGSYLDLGEFLHQQALAAGFVQDRDTSDDDTFERRYVSTDGVWAMFIVAKAFDAEASAQIGVSRI